jgi:hypothetical protein
MYDEWNMSVPGIVLFGENLLQKPKTIVCGQQAYRVFQIETKKQDRLCGLVFLATNQEGTGSITGATKFSDK